MANPPWVTTSPLPAQIGHDIYSYIFVCIFISMYICIKFNTDKANCGLVASQWEAAAPLAFQARLAAGLGAGQGRAHAASLA